MYHSTTNHQKFTSIHTSLTRKLKNEINMAKKLLTTPLNLKENLAQKFVAFIDVLGFSNLVNRGNVANLESYFEKITEELKKIKDDKGKIDYLLISDSIILITPDSLTGLKDMIHAVRRIQSALLWRKILLRGAVSFGEVYFSEERNIIVGKGYIKAYLLEKEAKFPRVMIDPEIIRKIGPDRVGFLNTLHHNPYPQIDDQLIYRRSDFSMIADDCIFIHYANKTVKAREINRNIAKVYENISDNLYADQSLYLKYVWLRDYFIEQVKLALQAYDMSTDKRPVLVKKNLETWLASFQRL